MRRAKLLRSLVFVGLVSAFLLVMASSAFAAYSQTFSVASPIVPGTTVNFNPSWTKAGTDPSDSPDGPWVDVRVSRAGIATGDVVGPGTSQWTIPDPNDATNVFAGDGPLRTGVGYLEFESFAYAPWVGDNTSAPAGLALNFLTAGDYTVEVKLVGGTWAADGSSSIVRQTSTYNLKVAAPPVVSTPASSPWSLALLAATALGVAAVVGRVRRVASSRV